MPVPRGDREVLRGLAAEVAEIARLPVQREKAELWRRLNDLEPVRPLVWIREIPWHEMNVDDELTLRCEDEWCRRQETGLRQTLYQWRHMRGDMVVSDYAACHLAIGSTGYGLGVEEDIAVTDPASDVVSHRYLPQIAEPGDVEKIRMPAISHDAAETERRCARMCEVYDGVLPVRKVGRQMVGIWPWDRIISWTGITEGLTMLADRPDMAHALIDRLSRAYMEELRQLEEQKLLSLNNDNTWIWPGGLGYTGGLPAKGFDAGRVRPHDMWGTTADQIFGHVSPAMHWEFGVQYELRWLSKCGLVGYGCCEPLDGKMEVLRRIPNLRRVSMSPWTNPVRAAAELRDEYVYSCKPTPALLAEERWRPEAARAYLRGILEKTRGCRLEIIMKDISTLRYAPGRLWEWERMAMELAEEFAP